MKRFFLKTLFSSVDGENDALWKRWHHQNRLDRVPDHSTVSIQNGRQTLPCGVVVWTGEYDTKTISVDTNHFENEQNGSGFVWRRSKTAPFSFDKGLVWTRPRVYTNLARPIEHEPKLLKSSEFYNSLTGSSENCCTNIQPRILACSNFFSYACPPLHERFIL